jgi:hypothetical protein
MEGLARVGERDRIELTIVHQPGVNPSLASGAGKLLKPKPAVPTSGRAHVHSS